MYKLVIITFIVNIFNSYGQTDKLRFYYETINKAELAIIDNDIPKAEKMYKNAFNTGISFPSDRFNAFRLSYIIKDTIQGREHFNALAALGQDKNKFIMFFLQTDTIPKDSFIDYAVQDYDSIYNIVMQSKMPEHAKLLDTIFQMDQACRKNRSPDTDLWACDSKVLEKMYKYIDLYGFPSAGKVGVMEKEVIQSVNPGTFDWLCWHSRGRDDIKLKKIGYENVLKGIYDARRYVRGFAYPGNTYYSILPDHELTIEELNATNKKRAEIFLEPLQDYYRKLTYQLEGGKFKREYYFVDMLICAYNKEKTLRITK